MNMKFFWIPAVNSDSAETELNQFLSSHRIVKIERNFLPNVTSEGWCLCVEWIPKSEELVASKFTTKERRIDYRDVLDDETFRIFAILRTWRKERSAAQGIPLYTVATNEQLARIARERIQTKSDLEKVEGFGSSRLGKYAEELIELCVQTMGTSARGSV